MADEAPKEPTQMSAAQLKRIQDAVKKPKDLFAMADQTPVRIPNYVLGKNERYKNPSRTRTSPQLPKAMSKTASSASLVKQPKSLQRDSSLRLVQTKVYVNPKMKPPQAGQKQSMAKKTTQAAATPAKKAFSNLKKTQQLPSAFKPISGSKSTPNLMEDSKEVSSMLMLPRISTNTSNADLENIGVEPSQQNQDLQTDTQGKKSTSKTRGKKQTKRHPSETETV